MKISLRENEEAWNADIDLWLMSMGFYAKEDMPERLVPQLVEHRKRNIHLKIRLGDYER